MTEEERQDLTRLVDVVESLPPEDKKFFLGYAKGVADMADVQKNEE